MDERVYERNVSISMEATKQFWSDRAKMYDAKGNIAVLCGDSDPAFAANEDSFDRNYILPKLNVNKSMRVLDIGCGIGRIAKMILPLAGVYCGTDFSVEMANITENICSNFPEKKAEYIVKPFSFAETVVNIDKIGGPFDIVIMFGVCTYINDAEAQDNFTKLCNLLADKCTLCFREAIGANTRLTLNNSNFALE